STACLDGRGLCSPERVPGGGLRASGGELTAMDPVTGDVMREPAVESVAGAATRERRHWARPQPRVQEPSHLHLERPSDARLQLQRRAPANLRHHLRRAVVRLLVLVLADLASFGVMRGEVRAVRDDSVVGQALARLVAAIVPAGIL